MSTALPPTGLLCELLRAPAATVICRPEPRFGWIFNDAAANAYQAGFQILAASTPALLAADAGDLWDSGIPQLASAWTTDSRSINVPYAGKPLVSDRAYHWKVRTWNAPLQVSPWSEPQAFRTGTLTGAHHTAGCRLVTREVAPVCVVRTAPDCTFVDFGRAAFATLKLRLSCPRAGQIVTVRLGEVAESAHAIARAPGGSRRYREVSLPLKKGVHDYLLALPPDARNTNRRQTPDTAVAILVQDDLPEVVPFRYAEITGLVQPAGRDEIRQVAMHHPFDDQAAAFVCSSRVLNDVWELCKYSMKATSFLGLYVDGDRERIPYETDAYINQLGHYCCDREFSMARRTHEHLIHNPNIPTEWILSSVLLAWADYEHTGDAASLAAYYPELQAKALVALARADGLISTVLKKPRLRVQQAVHLRRWMLDYVDWPQGERDHYDFRPVNTVINAFHFRAVTLLGRIAAVLGKPTDAAGYAAQAAKLQATMLATLRHPQTGLFVDGEDSTHSSLHANLFPLALGVVTGAAAEPVAAYLKSRGMACSVYAAHFLVEALYRAGEANAALALLTGTGERSWAHMVYEVGTTMSMEAWDNRFKPNQDWNHAWGAAPASLIPRWLMGVRPLEPGFGKLLIQPQPGSLAFADLRLPTIRGTVRVTVNQEPGRSFHVEVELPGNTTARVVVPRLGHLDTTVLVDGHRLAATPLGADRLAVDGLGSGRHTVHRG